MVRDVRNGHWNVWYKANVIKIIQTNSSHSVQVHYEDMAGITQNVTSCAIGGIIKAHDADIANALSYV